MSRIRTVKPELLKHEGLFDAEKETGLPLRIAFVGLLTCCDREGRFRWKPRRLKLDVLPYDDVDFECVLNELVKHGFVVRYEVADEVYGCIPTFLKHQRISGSEAASESEIPPPSEIGSIEEALRKHRGNTEEAPRKHPGNIEDPREGVLGKEYKERNKERGREKSTPPPLSPNELNKLIENQQMPEEWIELAIKRRSELPREQLIRLSSKFDIHYQGSSLTEEERFKKWMEWVVTEERKGGNGKSLRQLKRAEIARLDAADNEAFMNKGRGANGKEVPNHERV